MAGLSVLASASTAVLDHPRAVLRPEATYDSVGRDLLDRHVGALSFMAHGRDDALHLHDTLICANHRGKLPVIARPDLPTCAYTGACFRADVATDRILPADRVQADVVFSNSCMGLRLTDGLFPAEYLLAHGFQRGAAVGYVASAALVSGKEKLNWLFTEAVLSGVAFGQVASLLNDHLRYERSDRPYFTLIGVPWLRMPPADGRGGPQQPRCRFFGAWEVGEDDAAGSARSNLVDDPGADLTLPVFFASERTRTAAELVAGVPAERLARNRAYDVEVRLTGRTIENLSDLPLLGLKSSRLTNVMQNVREQVTSMARAFEEILDGDQPERASRRMATVRRTVDGAARRVADKVYERGTTTNFEFEDMFAGLLAQRAEPADGRSCHSCGNPLSQLRSSHTVFPRIERRSHICERCSVVEDLDLRSFVTRMTLDCADYWRRGTEQVIRLSVTCSADMPVPAGAYVASYVRDGLRLGVATAEPVRAQLKPGATTVCAFAASVDPDQTLTHLHHVKGFVVTSGTVSFASRPVWFHPAA